MPLGKTSLRKGTSVLPISYIKCSLNTLIQVSTGKPVDTHKQKRIGDTALFRAFVRGI